MVYYRKYRPQTISELDLDAVRDRLTSILNAKELPHAFLFTGPKGLGKTSSARILAKAINCETNEKNPKSNIQHPTSNIEPCNECDNCKSITAGSNIDVLEIDAASNRGIDEIRDLREKIKFAPVSLPRKVYIIDEVHMLTTDAFNALLKTLEEPPSHAIFILCTTEVEKVPATIASRTFHVSFEKPTEEEIKRALVRIVKGEKLEIEPKVLDEIFKLSEGSFRDAAKILEELVISANNKKITLEILSITYKTAGLEVEIQNLILAISKKDLQSSMKVIDELSKKGADFKIVTEKIAELIHGMLMSRSGIETKKFDIKEFDSADLKDLLERVNESYRNIKFSILPQIPLELAVIGYCLEDGIKNSELQIKEEKAEVSLPIPESPKLPEQPKEDPRPNNDTNHGVLFDANSKPENFLAAFLTRLKIDNHSIAGVLRGCRLVEIGKDSVVFETKFKFHRDKLSDAKTSTILDSRASELLRENVHVVVNLVDKPI